MLVGAGAGAVVHRYTTPNNIQSLIIIIIILDLSCTTGSGESAMKQEVQKLKATLSYEGPRNESGLVEEKWKKVDHFLSKGSTRCGP